MKKLIMIITLAMFTSSALGYSCPALWEELDYEISLAKKSGMSQAKIDEVQKLRDDGKKAHDEGNHGKSEDLLNKGLDLIKG